MAKRKHKKITPAEKRRLNNREPAPAAARETAVRTRTGARAYASRGAAAGTCAGQPQHDARRRAPTTPAATPTGPSSRPSKRQATCSLAKARAGLMSPEERQELYGLVAATMEALNPRRANEAEARRRPRVRARGQEATSGKGRSAGRWRTRGGRRHPRPITLCRGVQGLRFRAEEARRLASIKCFHAPAAPRYLRAGVKAACSEIAPYASPPQLTLALRGYEPPGRPGRHRGAVLRVPGEPGPGSFAEGAAHRAAPWSGYF